MFVMQPDLFAIALATSFTGGCMVIATARERARDMTAPLGLAALVLGGLVLAMVVARTVPALDAPVEPMAWAAFAASFE